MKVLRNVKFDQSGRIAIHANNRLVMIDICRILYCKADGNYSHIHLTDGNSFTTSYNLRFVSQKLIEFGFFTIDKSVVVNLQLIQSITQERQAKLTLTDCTELKIARNRKKELMDLLFCAIIPVNTVFVTFCTTLSTIE